MWPGAHRITLQPSCALPTWPSDSALTVSHSRFRVIAEQVETQADFETLRAIGVDFVQGNFIDPPHRLGEPSTALAVV